MTDRQLVCVVGFIAVIAYIAVGLLGFTLLVVTRVGRTWPVMIVAAGTGGAAVTGLAGLTVWAIRHRHARRRRRRVSKGAAR